MAKGKRTKADREFDERVEADIALLRGLAERGLAELERKAGRPLRPEGISNAEWLRQLAAARPG